MRFTTAVELGEVAYLVFVAAWVGVNVRLSRRSARLQARIRAWTGGDS